MRGGGGEDNYQAAIKYSRDLSNEKRDHEKHPQQSATTLYDRKSFGFAGVLVALSLLLLGALLVWFDYLGLAIVLIFVVPAAIGVYSMFSGKGYLDEVREEQMKAHMMAKGDKRYWGRGEGGDDE